MDGKRKCFPLGFVTLARKILTKATKILKNNLFTYLGCPTLHSLFVNNIEFVKCSDIFTFNYYSDKLN